MTTTTDQLHELGARWVAAEIAGDTDTLDTHRHRRLPPRRSVRVRPRQRPMARSLPLR